MRKKNKEERKERTRAEQSRKASQKKAKTKKKAKRDVKKAKEVGGVCFICKEPLDPALRLSTFKNAAEPGNWTIIPGPNYASTKKKVPIHAGCIDRTPTKEAS